MNWVWKFHPARDTTTCMMTILLRHTLILRSNWIGRILGSLKWGAWLESSFPKTLLEQIPDICEVLRPHFNGLLIANEQITNETEFRRSETENVIWPVLENGMWVIQTLLREYWQTKKWIQNSTSWLFSEEWTGKTCSKRDTQTTHCTTNGNKPSRQQLNDHKSSYLFGLMKL